LFLVLYTAYLLFVVLASTQHDAAAGFSSVMLWFVLPLVGIILLAVTFFELGVYKGRAQARKPDSVT
jgi:cation:H+ antiporter